LGTPAPGAIDCDIHPALRSIPPPATNPSLHSRRCAVELTVGDCAAAGEPAAGYPRNAVPRWGRAGMVKRADGVLEFRAEVATTPVT
jgi:hypothetical protein